MGPVSWSEEFRKMDAAWEALYELARALSGPMARTAPELWNEALAESLADAVMKERE